MCTCTSFYLDILMLIPKFILLTERRRNGSHYAFSSNFLAILNSLFSVLADFEGFFQPQIIIISWRIGVIISILGMFLYYFYLGFYYNVFPFVMCLQLLIITPLKSNTSCPACGYRLFWWPLITNKCRHCGKNLFSRINKPI